MLSKLRYMYALKCVWFVFMNGINIFYKRISQSSMKICIFTLGWNLKHKNLLEILVFTFLSIFVRNLWVLNSNMTDSILYLVSFPFKLTKHKMATEMFLIVWRTLKQVSKIILIELLFVSLERNYFYLTFKSKTSAVFDVSTVTVSILQNVLTIIWRILL